MSMTDDVVCAGCKAIYSAGKNTHCPVCREPNPLWEAWMREKLKDENMGDEAAWKERK